MIGGAITVLRSTYYAARIANMVSKTKTFKKLKSDWNNKRLEKSNLKKGKAISDYLSGKKRHNLQLEKTKPTPNIKQQNKVLNQAQRSDIAKQNLKKKIAANAAKKTAASPKAQPKQAPPRISKPPISKVQTKKTTPTRTPNPSRGRK